MILLHVVTPLSYPAGVLESGHEITARDLHAHIVQRAQKDLDQALRPELDGIAVTRVLLRGDPAHEIVKTARDQNVDLIVMSTRGHGRVLPLSAGLSDSEGAARKPLPGLDRRSPGRGAGARVLDPPRPLLGGFEPSQPPHRVAGRRDGRGRRRDAYARPHHDRRGESTAPADPTSTPRGRRRSSAIAAAEIAKLQQDVGTKAEVIIDSGNVPQLLNRAAEQTKADVLVIGHSPGRSHLGDNGNGYGIIRESHIPVLSV